MSFIRQIAEAVRAVIVIDSATGSCDDTYAWKVAVAIALCPYCFYVRMIIQVVVVNVFLDIFHGLTLSIPGITDPAAFPANPATYAG